MIVSYFQKEGITDNNYLNLYRYQEESYWKPVLKWILELDPVNSVIDVGAAYGTLLLYTSQNKKVNILHAVDPVRFMSTLLEGQFDIKLHSIDFERNQLNITEKFDLVIFTEVIEHLNFHPLPTLLKLKGLMRECARLVVSTPDAEEWGYMTDHYPSLDDIPAYCGQDFPWIDGHIWHYTKEELEGLFRQAGLEVERFEYSPGVAARHLCYLLKLAGK
jgi:SAM-dependent methyltransferase